MESLAGEIRKIVANKNWRFSDIGVSSPVLPAYRSLLEAVFRRYKIPFTFNEVRFIDQTLVIQHFLLIPELVPEDYSLLTVRKILQSPFFNYNESLKDTKYKNILNSLRARGGKKEILELLKREKAFYASSVHNNEPDETGAKRYDSLIQNITQLFRQAEFFEQPQSADSIYQFWSDFIAVHQITRRIQRESGERDGAWMEENLAALRSFLDALNNWKTIIREYYPGRRFDVRELSNILELMLGSASYRLRRPQNFGVQITPLKNLPTRKSKAIFVLGMKDGVFPGKGSPGFTHPQTIARELKPFLPDETIYRDRELFLKILQSDTEIIQFSSPRYHQDNPVLPSAFLREIERISEGKLSARRDTRLYTAADILTKIIRFDRNADLKRFESTGLSGNLQSILDKDAIAQFNFLKSVERRREITDDNSQWEGMLEGDEVTSRWLDAVYKSRRFSITQLEEYARCPVIYFFKRILHLEPEEEADELLTPLDKGITVHNILFRFYRENAAERRDLSRLLAIAEEELERIPVTQSILWQLQKEFYLGSSRHRGLFPAFWEYEQEIAGQYSTAPKHFELSFGNTRELEEDADPVSTTEPFLWEQDGEKFYFKGKIDRVEISDGGALLVVDYKTGTAPNTSSIWEGQNLQLPIYLKAVFDLLKDQYPVLDMAGGAYYSLKREQDIRKKIAFLDSRLSVGSTEAGKSVILPNDKYAVDDVPVSLEEFLERSLEFAAGYIRNIRSGKFPHTMDESQCRGWNGRVCKYLPLCRVNWRKQAAISRRSSRENDGQEESLQ
ncbi:MAG: PD-(D/E)XK nuclease family protein [Calditrichia bacterium]